MQYKRNFDSQEQGGGKRTIAERENSRRPGMRVEKTKSKGSSDDWNITCGGGAECIFGITAHNEEHEGRKFTPLCIKLVCNLQSYTSLYLRSEGNTCQPDGFVIQIKCDNIYVCFKKYKAFYKQKGIIVISGRLGQKERFDLNMTCLEVNMQSPAIVHQQPLAWAVGWKDPSVWHWRWRVGWAGMEPIAPAEPEVYGLAVGQRDLE